MTELEMRRRRRQIPELRARLQQLERAAVRVRESGHRMSRLLRFRLGWVHDQLRLAERAAQELRKKEERR